MPCCEIKFENVTPDGDGEVCVKGDNEIGQETSLIAEVFLSPEKVEELKIDNAKEKVKSDISEVCKELPLYKRVLDVGIRKEEFAKTTTNKIKR